MKRILATLTGTMLAAGLALAAPSDTPEEIVQRYFAAIDQESDQAGATVSWADWHPEATQKLTLKYGQGLPDAVFTFRLLDLATEGEMPAELAQALKGYRETSRTPPELRPEKTEQGLRITAISKVRYEWRGFAGEMTQTDHFHMVPHLGGRVIRTLDTTYDYR